MRWAVRASPRQRLDREPTPTTTSPVDVSRALGLNASTCDLAPYVVPWSDQRSTERGTIRRVGAGGTGGASGAVPFAFPGRSDEAALQVFWNVSALLTHLMRPGPVIVDALDATRRKLWPSTQGRAPRPLLTVHIRW